MVIAKISFLRHIIIASGFFGIALGCSGTTELASAVSPDTETSPRPARPFAILAAYYHENHAASVNMFKEDEAG
jgi:hypothetical protein